MGAPHLALLRLDTRFPRPVGDIGNPNTHAFPLRTVIVRGADAAGAVHGDPALLLPRFVEAARRCVADGALAIATSCGFLAPLQRELAATVPVPVATSALLQVPWVRSLLGAERTVGVLSIAPESLAPALAAAGAPPDTPLAGMPRDGALCRAVFGDSPRLDRERAETEAVAAARALAVANPSLGALVLECTNLPPYRRAIAAAIGVPVFDCNTLLDWLWQAVVANLTTTK